MELRSDGPILMFRDSDARGEYGCGGCVKDADFRSGSWPDWSVRNVIRLFPSWRLGAAGYLRIATAYGLAHSKLILNFLSNGYLAITIRSLMMYCLTTGGRLLATTVL